MAKLELTGWVCALSLVLPQLTAAQPALDRGSLPNEVSLQISPCNQAAYDPNDLAELLRVELRGLGVTKLRLEPAAAESTSTGILALIHLGCGSVPSTLAIELADMIGGNRVSRELLIDDVKPPDRARALSIAIASLLESSWSVLASRPAAASAGAGPVPMPEDVRTALRRRLSANLGPQPSAAGASDELPPVLQSKPVPLVQSALALRASVTARAFPSRGSGLTGFDFAIAPRVGSRLTLSFDLEAMYGRQLLRDAEGLIAELDTPWLSAGAALYFATQTRPDFLVGPMLRAAYLRALTSTSNTGLEAMDEDGVLMMFGLSSLLRFDFTPSWDLFFAVDIAYVPGGINFLADNLRAVSFADLSLALRLGFSWNS